MSKVLFSRTTGAVSFVVILVIIFGCMTINHGKDTSDCPSCGCKLEDNGIFTQTGSIPVEPNKEITVYYPATFEAIPNLQLTGRDRKNYEIIEQQSNYFRIKSRGRDTDTVKWVARGVKTPNVTATTLPDSGTGPILEQTVTTPGTTETVIVPVSTDSKK
jgi:hypothetical protein